MISVRFVASSGWKTVGSRLRTDVPLISAPNSSALKNTPIAVLRPSSATAMPKKPDAGAIWMSLVAIAELPAEHVDRARQPRERAADRHHHRCSCAPTWMPPYSAASGLKPTARDLVARDRAVQQHPEHEQRRERDEEADVQALQLGVAPEHRQLRAAADVVGDGHGPVCASFECSGPPRPNSPHADPQRDLVEHDRRDHLVGARRSPSGSPRSPPQSAPASAPRTSASTMCRTPGRPSNDEPTQTAEVERRRSTGPGRRC